MALLELFVSPSRHLFIMGTNMPPVSQWEYRDDLVIMSVADGRFRQYCRDVEPVCKTSTTSTGRQRGRYDRFVWIHLDGPVALFSPSTSTAGLSRQDSQHFCRCSDCHSAREVAGSRAVVGFGVDNV